MSREPVPSAAQHAEAFGRNNVIVQAIELLVPFFLAILGGGVIVYEE